MSTFSPNARKHRTKNPLKRSLLNRFYDSVKDIVMTINPRSVLDCGCGEGFLTQIIHQALPSSPIVGTDLSENAIVLAKERCPGMQFQVADIKKMPFDTATFDLVVCSEVLEHVPEVVSAFAELCRISAKNLLVTVPHEPYFRILNIFAMNHWRTFGNAPGHINHWSMPSFRKLLKTQMKTVKIQSSLPWILAYGTIRTSRMQATTIL